MRPTTLGIVGLTCALSGCADKPYNPNGPAVDPNAPVIHITSPSRGTIAGDVQTVTVTGTATDDVSVASVTVNDLPAQLAGDGTWSVTVPVVAGTNLLHAVAKDGSGNEGKVSRAVYAGPMSPIAMSVPSAITTTLSAQTFAAIGKGAGNFITGGDLASLLSADNPVVDVGGGPDCLYGQGSITSFTVGGAAISLVPQDGGLALDGELDNVDVGMHLDYAAACISGSRDITISATHVSVKGNLAIGVASGAFSIGLDNPDVTLTGFDLELGGIPGAVVDLLDLNDAMGPILGWATEKFVVPMLSSSLSSFANTTQTVQVLNTMVDISVKPSQVTFSDQGGVLELDTSLRAHGDDMSPGFVDVANQLPAMDLSHGFQLAVAANAANQLLASMWAAKGLDDTLDLTSGPYGDIGQLFDSVELAASVPPFVDASSGNGLVLTVGDLTASFKNGDQLATEVAINAQVDLKVENDQTGALRFDVGTPTTYVDILDASDGVEGANQLSNAQFEAITSFALSRIIAVGSGTVGAIPLPTVAGVSVTSLTIGEQTGYLVVDGQVQ